MEAGPPKSNLSSTQPLVIIPVITATGMLHPTLGQWCSGAMFPEACWRFLVGSAGSSNIAGWARGLLWSGGLVVALLLSSGVRCVLVDRQARWTIGLEVGSLLEALVRVKGESGDAIAVGNMGGVIASYAKISIRVGAAPPFS